MDNTNDDERPGNAENGDACPAGVPGDAAEVSAPAPVLRCIAWCPDDGDETTAREYVGSTPKEIAEQHAEYVWYEQGTQREHYDIRVRATKGDHVREWDVTVDVEIQVSFDAALAFPVKPSKKPDAPAQAEEATPCPE